MRSLAIVLAATLLSYTNLTMADCNTTTIKATTPTVRYTIAKNGTVLDKITGLTWKRCPEGQTWSAANSSCSGTASFVTWQQALKVAESVTFAGVSDWRLPNIKELQSIVEFQCSGVAVNNAVFGLGSDSGYFWTSTSRAYSAESSVAWVIDFYFGRTFGQIKTGNAAMLLVRGG